MIENEISSDSSFYIGFTDDLNRKDLVHSFINLYSFYLGQRILEELPDSLTTDNKFISSINKIEVDYYELIKPYFGRSTKHIYDGEYEAIGIAHYLDVKGSLHYLIIDEKKIRNFITRHFPYLSNKLVGSIGFTRDCCTKDKKINISYAIDILKLAKEKIDKGKRVFGIDKKSCEEIIDPIIKMLSLRCIK